MGLESHGRAARRHRKRKKLHPEVALVEDQERALEVDLDRSLTSLLLPNISLEVISFSRRHFMLLRYAMMMFIVITKSILQARKETLHQIP